LEDKWLKFRNKKWNKIEFGCFQLEIKLFPINVTLDMWVSKSKTATIA